MVAVIGLELVVLSSLLLHLGSRLGLQKEHSLLGGLGAFHDAWLKRCLVISVSAAWVLNTRRSLSRLGWHGDLLLIKSKFIQKLFVLFCFKVNLNIVCVHIHCTDLLGDILQWPLS